MTNMDILFDRVAAKGAVCLGLDTSPEYLPESLAARFPKPAGAVFEFNRNIIDATADAVACYKVQIAYYEAMGLDGMRVFAETLRYVKAAGVPVITDCKRGDIKASAEMYAKAHLGAGSDFESDFITLNPYMGLDTLEPYEPYLERGKGVFVLLRTSNPGWRDIQGLPLAVGGKVYSTVAVKIARLGEKYMGEKGFSSVGMVVGATDGGAIDADAAEMLRNALGGTFFLVPGYGAQGGAARDAAYYFKNGNGGAVNSSRAILTAYQSQPDGEERYAHYAREEVLRMAKDIGDNL